MSPRCGVESVLTVTSGVTLCKLLNPVKLQYPSQRKIITVAMPSSYVIAMPRFSVKENNECKEFSPTPGPQEGSLSVSYD